MAEKRERHAQIRTRIWDDDDWKARSPLAQWLYMLLLSQASLNKAGVVDLTLKRWGNLADGAAAALRPAMDELTSTRYIIIDWDTEELLIRSYMRNDEVWKQPNTFKMALRQAQEVLSPAIRRALAIELRRIAVPSGVSVADLLDGGSVNPSAIPSRKGSTISFANPPIAEGFAEPQGDLLVHPRGEGEGVSSSSLVSSSSSSSFSSDVAPRPRPDVDQLCAKLKAGVEGNGAKATVTKAWRDEARRLIDRDHRELDQALRLIDWATSHSFWAANILSMPTFRKQYDKLLIQARREQQERRAVQNRPSTTDRRIAEAERLKTNPDPRILALGGLTMPDPSLELPGGEVA